MNAIPNSIDTMMAELRQEFLDTSLERLDSIEKIIFESHDDTSVVIRDMYRDVHNMKGGSGSFDLPSITLVVNRFEEYLSDLTDLDDAAGKDIALYIDALRSIIQGGREPTPDQLQAMLKTLPVRTNQDFDVDDPLDIEIMLVTAANAVGRAVSAELRGCGYRVTSIESPWRALQFAACSRPDLIITSMVLEGLDGIDLMRAVGAIAPTRGIPVAALTSFKEGHPALAALPDDAQVIRVGEYLRDDLANALDRLGII